MARETTRSQTNPPAEKPAGKSPADQKLDQLFADMEDRARGFLKSVESWVNRGDELLTKSKLWLDEHPVALAMADKYTTRMQKMPRTAEQAKESLRAVGSKVGSSARRTMSTARANPVETALVGGAVGILAWAALRSGRSQG